MTGQPIPTLSKLGVVVIIFGFLFDLVEHTLVVHTYEPRLAGFPLSEPAAHFVVILGMALVLAGIMIQGWRLSAHERHRTRSRFHRSRRHLDAIR